MLPVRPSDDGYRDFHRFVLDRHLGDQIVDIGNDPAQITGATGFTILVLIQCGQVEGKATDA